MVDKHIKTRIWAKKFINTVHQHEIYNLILILRSGALTRSLLDILLQDSSERS